MCADGKSWETLGSYSLLAFEDFCPSSSDIGLNTGKKVFRKITKEIPYK